MLALTRRIGPPNSERRIRHGRVNQTAGDAADPNCTTSLAGPRPNSASTHSNARPALTAGWRSAPMSPPTLSVLSRQEGTTPSGCPMGAEFHEIPWPRDGQVRTTLSKVSSAYSHVAPQPPSMRSRSIACICRAIPKLLRQHALTFACATAPQVTFVASRGHRRDMKLWARRDRAPRMPSPWTLRAALDTFSSPYARQGAACSGQSK